MALLLGHGGEEGQGEFPVTDGTHGAVDEHRADAQGSEPTDALEGVHRISCEPADILDHHLLKQPRFRIPEELPEGLAFFQGCAADALVGVEPGQGVTISPGVFRKEFLLVSQAFELLFLVGGYPAVGCDDHDRSLRRADSFRIRSLRTASAKRAGVLGSSKINDSFFLCFAIVKPPFHHQCIGPGVGA